MQHWNNPIWVRSNEMLEHIAWSQFSRDDYEDGTHGVVHLISGKEMNYIELDGWRTVQR